MISLTGAEVAHAVGGRLSVPAESGSELSKVRVTGPVVVDSRQVVPGALFAAVKGEHTDGHEYAAAAHTAGAALVLADRDIPAVPCVVVDDVVAALGRLARAHLDRLWHPAAGKPAPGAGLLGAPVVIGITGSSGKTTTKDLLAQVLAAYGPTVAPPESYNNEIGVPLTVLQADDSTRYLILEMGARGRGHVAYLCGVAPPRVGVVLNVGLAHAGEFGTKQDTAQAKRELIEALPSDGLAVLNADDEYVFAMRDRSRAPVITFGGLGDVTARDVRLDERGRATFGLVSPAGEAEVRLRLSGRHHVGNALAVAAVAIGLGMAVQPLATALSAAGATSRWRMEVHERPDGVIVVNDAYNANPESMRAALDALMIISRAGREIPGDHADAPTPRRTWAVLGEMLELGPSSADEHEAVGRLAARLGVDRTVAVGVGAEPIHRGAADAARHGRHGADATVGDPNGPQGRLWSPIPAARPVASLYVADAAAAVAVLRAELRPGDVVLVKASRGIGLERVADALLAEDEAADRSRPADERAGRSLAVAEGGAEEVAE
jgi:UDP-N-acetylmuramoyl-tripeptide--D-alanyl-D-alanine ligase